MVKGSPFCRPMFSLPNPDGETERDKWLAKESRAFLLDRIPIGTEVEIDAKFDGADDHGSYIAPLSIDGSSLGEVLVSAGLAAAANSKHYSVEDSWEGVEQAREVAAEVVLAFYPAPLPARFDKPRTGSRKSTVPSGTSEYGRNMSARQLCSFVLKLPEDA